MQTTQHETETVVKLNDNRMNMSFFKELMWDICDLYTFVDSDFTENRLKFVAKGAFGNKSNHLFSV